MMALQKKKSKVLLATASLMAVFFIILAFSPLLTLAKAKKTPATKDAKPLTAQTSKPKKQPIVDAGHQSNLANMALAADGLEPADSSAAGTDNQQTPNQQTMTASNDPASTDNPAPAAGSSITTTDPAPAPSLQLPQQITAPASDPSAASASNNQPVPASPAVVQPHTQPAAQPPAPTKIAMASQPLPDAALTQQTQDALTALSQNVQKDLWNPVQPTSNASVYATDAYSPEFTRLLTIIAFGLIFLGLILRRLAPQQQAIPNFGFQQQKLSYE